MVFFWMSGRWDEMQYWKGISKAESRSHMAKLTSCRVSTIGASMKKYTKRVRVGMASVMNA